MISNSLPAAMPASATRIATATSIAASATQRSCWRSVPRARRKRTTGDSAPTTTPATVIPLATTSVIAIGSWRA
jgi:hypothetical protein